MFRVVIIYKNGIVSEGQNFNTKEEVEDYVLKESDKGIKRADMKNLETGKRERIY